MTYKAGELEVYLKPCRRDGDDDCAQFLEEGHECVPMDSRGDYEKPVPSVALPHSCDAWVIGGPESIRALIADLQAALTAIEAK